MAEIKPCPQCGETPIVGYACGDYFIMPLSKPLFMCACSSFVPMHASEEREIEEWNKYVERWKSNKMNEILQMALDENKTLKNEIEKLKAENDALLKENKILSDNADTAFQDGLNENQVLFEKTILIEFIKKLEQKIGRSLTDGQEVIIPIRCIEETLKEMRLNYEKDYLYCKHFNC